MRLLLLYGSFFILHMFDRRDFVHMMEFHCTLLERVRALACVTSHPAWMMSILQLSMDWSLLTGEETTTHEHRVATRIWTLSGDERFLPRYQAIVK